MKTQLDEIEELVAEVMARDGQRFGNQAAIFWEFVELCSQLQIYEAVRECELRRMAIPRKLKEFAKIFRLSVDYRQEREMIESRLSKRYAKGEL